MTSRAWWALATLSLAMLLSSLGTSVANVALPTFEDEFGATFGQVQWVVLAYLLAVSTHLPRERARSAMRSSRPPTPPR